MRVTRKAAWRTLLMTCCLAMPGVAAAQDEGAPEAESLEELVPRSRNRGESELEARPATEQRSGEFVEVRVRPCDVRCERRRGCPERGGRPRRKREHARTELARRRR